MYEYVKKKERRRRIKAKGAQEERNRTVGRSENLGGEGAFSNWDLSGTFKDLCGTFVGTLYDLCGTCLSGNFLGPLWDLFWTFLEPFCDLSGTFLGPLWDLCGTFL